MKLRNSTSYPDHFLRRLLAWCCREVGYPPSRVRLVQFRNRARRAYSGHAYGSRRIVVSIGPDALYPTRPDTRPGMANEAFADRLEGLIAITAHEVAHLAQYAEQRGGRLSKLRKTEFDARWHEIAALRAFRANREALLSAWNEPPAERPAKPKATVQERRAAKAVADLERWQRKLKLAQTKCKQYRRRVAYYERVAACKTKD